MRIEEEQMADRVSPVAGGVINERNQANIEREALFEVIQGMNVTTNLDDLFKLIHLALKKVIFAENCFIAIHNTRTGLFEFSFFVDQYDQVPPPLRAQRTATGYVFRTGRPALFTKSGFQEMVERGEAEIVGLSSHSWMGVPLRTPTELIGVLAVQSYDNESAYTERNLEFLASIGSQVALAIARKLAEQALRQALDELEAKVAERTADLAKANKILRMEIAERQRTEMAMQASERQFSMAFHASPVPMGIIGFKDNCYRDVNESFLRVSGYTREDVIGRTAEELKLWAEPSEFARFRQMFKEQGSVRESEFGFRIKSGQLRHFLVSAEGFKVDGEPYLLAIANDITERNRAEQSLCESEDRFRTLAETACDAFITIDESSTIVFVNPAAENIFGYTQAEMLGTNLTALMPEFLRDLHKTGFNCNVQSGQKHISWQATSLTGLHRDGREIPLEISIGEFTSNGRRLFTGIVRDITERKRAEQALRESQERMTGIINSAMDAIITVDADQRVILFNVAAEQMFGYSASEVIGQSLDRFIPKRFRSTHNKHIPAFGQANVTKRRMGSLGAIFGVRANGEEFPIEASISQVESGGQKIYTVILRDITERKQAEEELRQSEERYRRLFQTAPDAIYTLSVPDGVVTSMNPTCEKITGWTPAELVGRHFANLIYPDDVPIANAIFQEVLLGKQPDPYELRIPAKSGGYVIAEFRTIPQMEGGKIIGTLGIARDISERKHVEAEIRRLNEDLELRVKERTAQFEAANRELESFSYTVSHDLRAPLRAVAGFSRILREDYEPDLPVEAQRYLQRVQENAQQMGRLIDDLLAFSRLGRQALNRQAVAPASLVREVFDDLSSDQAGRNLEIVIGDLPKCQADPALLKQVFVNLLANALKFTRRKEAAVIEIGCLNNGSQPHEPAYFVKDNGAGFDMRFADKLFGVFQRLHRAEEYEGTGVGLAIVQRIINRHGGRIWAEAQLGQGATFYFTLGGGGANG